MNRYDLAAEEYESHAEMYPHGCGCAVCRWRLADERWHQQADDAQLRADVDGLLDRLAALDRRRLARLEGE